MKEFRLVSTELPKCKQYILQNVLHGNQNEPSVLKDIKKSLMEGINLEICSRPIRSTIWLLSRRETHNKNLPFRPLASLSRDCACLDTITTITF